MKKYGMYITLFVVTAILGSAGYISETKREEEIKSRLTQKHSEKMTDEQPAAPVSTSNKIAMNVDETTEVEVVKEIKYIKPVSGEAFTGFSDKEFIYSKTMDDFRTHLGLDFMCNSGEEIISSADGMVTDVYNDDFLGLCIQVEHPDNIITRYCSLSEAHTEVGKTVAAGEKIGVAGNTSRLESADGIHLHFEVLKDGKLINPSFIF